MRHPSRISERTLPRSSLNIPGRNVDVRIAIINSFPPEDLVKVLGGEKYFAAAFRPPSDDDRKGDSDDKPVPVRESPNVREVAISLARQIFFAVRDVKDVSSPGQAGEDPRTIAEVAREIRKTPRVGADVSKAYKLMQQFLREWKAPGHSLTELVELLGAPGERKPDRVIYYFDTGYGGWMYTFRIEDGKITSVEQTGLE